MTSSRRVIGAIEEEKTEDEQESSNKSLNGYQDMAQYRSNRRQESSNESAIPQASLKNHQTYHSRGG